MVNNNAMGGKLNGFLLFLLLFCGVCRQVVAQDFPAQPSTLVNDYTQTLAPSQVAQLERKLVAFDDSTSTQIAVVVMQSTGQYDIADYGVRLASSGVSVGQSMTTGFCCLWPWAIVR